MKGGCFTKSFWVSTTCGGSQKFQEGGTCLAQGKTYQQDKTVMGIGKIWEPKQNSITLYSHGIQNVKASSHRNFVIVFRSIGCWLFCSVCDVKKRLLNDFVTRIFLELMEEYFSGNKNYSHFPFLYLLVHWDFKSSLTLFYIKSSPNFIWTPMVSLTQFTEREFHKIKYHKKNLKFNY